MAHLVVELVLWMLLAFFGGCLLGSLAREVFGQEAELAPAPAAAAEAARPLAEPVAEPPPASQAEPERPPAAGDGVPVAAAPPAPQPPPTPRAAVVPDPLPSVPSGKPERPRGIPAPREGKPDNLQRISGIGPKNERTLHSLGFYHFDQIAGWTEEQIIWVDEHLKFNGRIMREEWILQARLLAEGKEEEFVQLYGSGGLRTRTGEAGSTTRARRR